MDYNPACQRWGITQRSSAASTATANKNEWHWAVGSEKWESGKWASGKWASETWHITSRPVRGWCESRKKLLSLSGGPVCRKVVGSVAVRLG